MTKNRSTLIEIVWHNMYAWALVLSLAMAVPMAFSRFFPGNEGFPATDGTFLYLAGVQSVLSLVLIGGTAAMALAGRNWTTVPYEIALPSTITSILALPHFAWFSEFFILAGASWVLVTIVAIYLAENPEKRMSLARLSHEGKKPMGVTGNSNEDVQKYPALRPKLTFKAIQGMDALKNKMLDAGQEVVDAKQRKGASRNGILLFGSPGNGKTALANALAGELGLPIITATFGQVASRFVNQTTEQVIAVFRAARAQAPCVLFLDEMDSVLKDRSQSASSNDEADKTTNAILTELVNTRDAGVVIIGATNYLDKLDPAAIREGRFDFKIEVTPPDEIARTALLQNGLAQFEQLRIDPGAIELAAKRWEGFSVARIRAVADETGRMALKEGFNEISYLDLKDALRNVQGRSGRIPENTPLLSELTMPEKLTKLLRGIANRMANVEEVEALGGKAPNGLLFAGPPGTGKTVTARALAKTAEWAFIGVTGNELLSNPDKIDSIVREARDIRPTLVFIDEADDVLADRRYARHSASVTNRLLTAIDGAGGKTQDIIWVAATNHPDQLDPAALRGGRFTVKLEFELPDRATVERFVQKWMAQTNARFDSSATPDRIAHALGELSIANVSAVMQLAVDCMVDRVMENDGLIEADSVTLADIQSALVHVVG
ncbi:AAA family ATPase [Thauera mechernichensis]